MLPRICDRGTKQGPNKASVIEMQEACMMLT